MRELIQRASDPRSPGQGLGGTYKTSILKIPALIFVGHTEDVYDLDESIPCPVTRDSSSDE